MFFVFFLYPVFFLFFFIVSAIELSEADGGLFFGFIDCLIIFKSILSRAQSYPNVKIVWYYF